MPKKAVSVTLDADNLTWLQGQALATKARGLSETLDRLVTDARLGGRVAAQAIRSVAGTIEIHPDDPGLDQADSYLQSMFDRSLRRPIVVREAAAGYGKTGRRRSTSRGGEKRRG